ncbi:hypothetical protein JTB14_007869 [Gonioctena quinquepunctata]|nr:hypothetical protein JTB14_007869 [Gonioctena quinquepunctata]
MENSDFTEEEIVEEVQIFLTAGSETSATVLNCILVMLGMHPEIQQRVFDEIVETLGPDRTVLPSDLPNLKYMERVIKETMRIWPAAAIFLRTVGEDIDIGEAVIPAGTTALFGTIHIHRNPEYWPDPLKFDPDRFLPENVAQRHPCAYVPFSYGSRNCIGGRYAMMVMKTILTTVLRRYKIFTAYRTVEEIEVKLHLLMKLKNGSKISIELR